MLIFVLLAIHAGIGGLIATRLYKKSSMWWIGTPIPMWAVVSVFIMWPLILPLVAIFETSDRIFHKRGK